MAGWTSGVLDPDRFALVAPLMSTDPTADAERLRRLRRMQGVALGLLLFAAVVVLLGLLAFVVSMILIFVA